MSPLERTDQIIDLIEQIILVTMLSVMIFLAFIQIVLRNIFITGFSWADPLVRVLVLWVGLIGASLATKECKHINIDLISKGLPSQGKTISKFITNIFSFFISLLLLYASLKFLRNEIQMGGYIFLKIPVWILQSIIPISFFIMSFRFLLKSLRIIF